MKAAERRTDLYAKLKTGHNGTFYFNFYPSLHVYTVSIIGFDASEVDPVLVRDLREGEESPYWAWWDTDRECFCHVYPKRLLVEMCFPYGIKVEEKHGKGQVVNVWVEKRKDHQEN